jgi:hypothetical protein
MGEKIKSYRVVVDKFEGEKPLGRLRDSWENNIKVDVKEIGWECVDWNDIAQNRVQVAASCEQSNVL